MPNGIIVRHSVAMRDATGTSILAPGRREFRQQSPQASPVPVPSIQVTIGRVEVRATPAAAPARPRAKKETEMSLETYLQHRAEGGRR